MKQFNVGDSVTIYEKSYNKMIKEPDEVDSGKIQQISTYANTKDLHEFYDEDEQPAANALTLKVNGEWHVEFENLYFCKKQ